MKAIQAFARGALKSGILFLECFLTDTAEDLYLKCSSIEDRVLQQFQVIFSVFPRIRTLLHIRSPRSRSFFYVRPSPAQNVEIRILRH